jgi:hypothetical protein
MSSFSLRLTHKITAIGIIGVVGVVLVGGMHMYGEAAKAGYRISCFATTRSGQKPRSGSARQSPPTSTGFTEKW